MFSFLWQITRFIFFATFLLFYFSVIFFFFFRIHSLLCWMKVSRYVIQFSLLHDKPQWLKCPQCDSHAIRQHICVGFPAPFASYSLALPHWWINRENHVVAHAASAPRHCVTLPLERYSSSWSVFVCCHWWLKGRWGSWLMPSEGDVCSVSPGKNVPRGTLASRCRQWLKCGLQYFVWSKELCSLTRFHWLEDSSEMLFLESILQLLLQLL